MKLIKGEKIGDTSYEMEIQIEPEIFKEAVSKVFRREGKKYNVPGFRKGKAPRNLIEKMYGEQVFHYDAINDLFSDTFDEAAEEAGVEPVDRPEVDVISSSVEDGVELNVVVTIKPEIQVGNYKGLEVEKTVYPVDEKEVDAEIERLQERNARIITREGAAEEGDIADIDYEGFMDDVPFEGGKGEKHKLTLGSGQFIPGFEDQVIGHKAGEEFDVTVTFPEEYHAEQLAGKKAVFKVKINEIQYKELPELDDEFAKDVSEYDTLEELKQSLRDKMKEANDQRSEVEMETELLSQLMETIEGEIPPVMYDNRVDEMVQDFQIRLQQQGLNLPTYLQYAGMDMESFRSGFKVNAEKDVQSRLILEAIARQENIEAAEDEIDEEIQKLAEKYNMDTDKIREIMPGKRFAEDIKVTKAANLIKDNAVVTEKEYEPEQAKESEESEKTETEESKED